MQKVEKVAFDACLGAFQNLDHGPDEALKPVFLIHGQNFGTDGPRDQKFWRELKQQKIFDTCPGVFQNLVQGPDGALKLFFLI